jgi:uncharacterized protein DUF4157
MGAEQLKKLLPAPTAAMSGLGGRGGSPLPPTVRHDWETRLGQNFGDVRVHEGNQATLVGADAFTTGENIFFRPGKYQPHGEGSSLLGHELTHVVQQRAAHEQIRVAQGLVEVEGGASPAATE